MDSKQSPNYGSTTLVPCSSQQCGDSSTSKFWIELTLTLQVGQTQCSHKPSEPFSSEPLLGPHVRSLLEHGNFKHHFWFFYVAFVIQTKQSSSAIYKIVSKPQDSRPRYLVIWAYTTRMRRSQILMYGVYFSDWVQLYTHTLETKSISFIAVKSSGLMFSVLTVQSFSVC